MRHPRHFLLGHFDINDIIGAAGRSKEGTFQKFYNWDIISDFNFGGALLNASVSDHL